MCLHIVVHHRQETNLTLVHVQGKDNSQAPLPDILTFASPDSDAAITFINSTTANGVVFQHGMSFDMTATADLLVVFAQTFPHNYARKPTTLSYLLFAQLHACLSWQVRAALRDEDLADCGDRSSEHIQIERHRRHLALSNFERLSDT